MARPVLLLALLGGASLLAAPAVSAHGIQSTLEYLPSSGTAASSGSLELQSSFSTGVPARDAAVRLMPPDGGKAIELGHTGPDGRLTFTLPSTARTGWEIQVDAGPGHRDYLEPADAGNAPAGGSSTTHASQPHHHRSWPSLRMGALTGIALVGGVGLVARLRRRS
jgi:nickel transport protein